MAQSTSDPAPTGWDVVRFSGAQMSHASAIASVMLLGASTMILVIVLSSVPIALKGSGAFGVYTNDAMLSGFVALPLSVVGLLGTWRLWRRGSTTLALCAALAWIAVGLGLLWAGSNASDALYGAVMVALLLWGGRASATGTTAPTLGSHP